MSRSAFEDIHDLDSAFENSSPVQQGPRIASDRLSASMFLPEPANQIGPERAVALPGQEGWRAPVGSAIGREDRAAPLSDVAHGDERIIAEARQHFRVRPSGGAVIAQELRPVGQALEDWMIGLDEG